jgi:hypothetical protein
LIFARGQASKEDGSYHDNHFPGGLPLIANILAALHQIKSDVARHLEPAVIRQACAAVDHRWRERVLDPVTTIHGFLLQVLYGNTACDHVSHLMGRSFSGEAYCQARARLPLELFERLLRSVCRSMKSCRDEAARWHGHRVWLTDGSSCSMPDTPELQAAFGQPGGQAPGCGFPVAHLLALFHAGTGLLEEVLMAPLRTHDMALATRLHPRMERGDVLVGDRGFCSFVHLVSLAQAGLHGVFRIHQRILVDFRIGRLHVPPGANDPFFDGLKGLPHSRWVKWQGRLDQQVEYFKPAQRPRWMTREAFAALPASLTVRELRYEVSQRGFRTRRVTLVTTLLDPTRYPAADLAQLYFDRWRVELHLRHLKQTLHLDVLRTKTVAGVNKELRMLALVYNLVRLVMLEAAQERDVPVERISFIDALRWLTHSRPSCDLSRIVVNPSRVGRIEPRVKKRRPKEYDLLRKPRAELKQALMQQRPAA